MKLYVRIDAEHSYATRSRQIYIDGVDGQFYQSLHPLDMNNAEENLYREWE